MKKTKEMTVSELQARYAELKEQANVINDKVEVENRRMNDGERAEWDTIIREVDAIKRELQLRSMSELPDERDAKYAYAVLPNILENTKERQAAGAKFRQLLTEQRGAMYLELRESVTATGTQEAANVIPVLIKDFIAPLEKGLVLSQLGVTMRTGLTANESYPVMPYFEANFVEEKETVVDTIIEAGALKPRPHRITVSCPITSLANVQTDGKLYTWIIDNLALAVARSLNRWILQPTAVVTDLRGALAYDASANPIQQVDLKGGASYKKLLSMRGMLQREGIYNDGTYAYVMSGMLAADLEATPRFEGGEIPIIVDGKIGGVPVLLSEFVEATGANTFNETPMHVGFARWSDLMVGQFGTMKLTIDPFSEAKAGTTNLILDTEYSVDPLRHKAFVIGTITA